jgi:hypothetical protein
MAASFTYIPVNFAWQMRIQNPFACQSNKKIAEPQPNPHAAAIHSPSAHFTKPDGKYQRFSDWLDAYVKYRLALYYGRLG